MKNKMDFIITVETPIFWKSIVKIHDVLTTPNIGTINKPICSNDGKKKKNGLKNFGKIKI